MSTYTIFILNGGQSRRMGQPKSQIKLGGQTFLEWTLDLAQLVQEPVKIVGKSVECSNRFSVSSLPDEMPVQTPLVGIYTALKHSNTEWNFILACDYPLMDEVMVHYLWQHTDPDFDAVIPSVANMRHPLVGFYQKRIKEQLQTFIQQGGLKVQDFLAGIRVKEIALEKAFKEERLKLPFMNINEPADVKRLQQAAGLMAC